MRIRRVAEASAILLLGFDGRGEKTKNGISVTRLREKNLRNLLFFSQGLISFLSSYFPRIFFYRITWQKQWCANNRASTGTMARGYIRQPFSFLKLIVSTLERHTCRGRRAHNVPVTALTIVCCARTWCYSLARSLALSPVAFISFRSLCSCLSTCCCCCCPSASVQFPL